MLVIKYLVTTYSCSYPCTLRDNRSSLYGKRCRVAGPDTPRGRCTANPLHLPKEGRGGLWFVGSPWMPYLSPKVPECNSTDAVNEANLLLRAYSYSEESVSVRFHYQLQLIRWTQRLSALRYCLFVAHMIRLSGHFQFALYC